MKKTARPFTMVRRSLWGSDRFAALPDDSCRYLYFYLLTCPHQTSAGCFALKEAYALADLAMHGAAWSVNEYRRAREALKASGLILTDDATGEVLIDRWWKDHPPDNESHFIGARRQCGSIRSEALRTAALDALEACWAEFTAAKPPTPANVSRLRASPEIALEDRYKNLGGRPRPAAA